jgi:hypothetical protein
MFASVSLVCCNFYDSSPYVLQILAFTNVPFQEQSEGFGLTCRDGCL